MKKYLRRMSSFTLWCFIATHISCIIQSNSQDISRTAIIYIEEGYTKDLNIDCHDNHISIVTVSFACMTNSFVGLKEDIMFDPTRIKKEISVQLNYLKKTVNQIKIDHIGDHSGKLEVQYACVNITSNCDSRCDFQGSTCISSLEGADCMCLQVPDKQMQNILCSDAKYLGCYPDDVIHHDIVLNVTSVLKPSVCIQLCQMIGYPYAGLSRVNNGCQCYNSKPNLTKVVQESSCLAPCVNEPKYSCGRRPYLHVYDTGFTEKNSSCEVTDICPNGTYCLAAYDSHVCLCNYSSVYKPASCYGCLPGWFSIPSSKDCFIVTDLSKLSNQTEGFCDEYYGKAVEISTIKELILLLRVGIDRITEEDSYEEVGKKFFENQNVDPFSGKQLPLCQRPKAVITGKYPWAKWPTGSFALPMPTTGCSEYLWETGFHEQDTEDSNTTNLVSGTLHLEGKFNNDSIKQGFCIKKNESGGDEWPSGRYCIYKKGNCPSHLKPGEIFWDDEDDNNKNKRTGVLPDGMYKADTQIEFCCSTNEFNRSGIVLPRDSPFFLFPYGEKRCQPVVGTKSTLEFVQWDMENDFIDITAAVAFKLHVPYSEITEKKKNLLLYYCYYEPIASCGPPFFKAHIHLNQSTFHTGHVINYSCDPGYINVGDTEDICLPSEIWSSIKGANCIDIDECRTGHDCHVKANCYNTLGSYYCQCNPGWTGNGRSCTAVKCGDPPTIENGHHLSPLRYPAPMHLEGSKLILACHEGYYLIGNNVSTCMNNGEWSRPAECIEMSECTPGSYKCSNHFRLGVGDYQHCECETFEELQNNTKHVVKTQKDLTTVKIIITVVVSLVAVIIVVVLIIFVLLRFRRKEEKKHARNMKTAQSNSSIYADINEFRLNVKIDKCRKESGISNQTNVSDSKYTSTPPHLPPRTSVTSTESSSSTENRLNPLQRPEATRRRSDFSCSDSFIIPNKQFSTIFEQEPLSQKFSDANDRSLTQFKLNSITQRRTSEQRFAPCMFSWNKTQYNNPTAATTQNNSTPTFFVGDNVSDGGESLHSCGKRSVLENPYIDINAASDVSDNEKDDSYMEYDFVPKKSIEIALRHRSYTDCPGIKPDQRDSPIENLYRSISLPGTLFQNEIESEDDYHTLKPRIKSQLSNSSDEVFFDYEHKNKSQSQRKRKKAISKFSFRFKLTSFKNSNNKNKNSSSSARFSDLSSRLIKYLAQKDDETEVRQRRSETVSF